MNKKIILSVVLVLSLVLSIASVSFAEGEFKLNIRADEWVKNEAGKDTVDVFVSFENNPGVAGLGFVIEYDQNLLEPIAFEQLEAIPDGATVTNLAKCRTRADGHEVLRVTLVNTVNQYDDGDIYKVTFAVAKYASFENSETETEIKLAINERAKFYNETWDEITPVYGSTTVVLPVIEGEGEVFDPENSEVVEEDDGYVEPDVDDIIGSITKPSNTTNFPTVKRYNTIIVLTIDSVNIKVNDNTLINDVAPIIVNDRTMLPIRIVAQELGADEILWDEANQKVTVVDGDKKIEVFINSDIAYVNGETVKLDSPAFIQNDRTYLPLRFISENLGASVDWDGDLQQVTIKK